jgi:hypothetical protein
LCLSIGDDKCNLLDDVIGENIICYVMGSSKGPKQVKVRMEGLGYAHSNKYVHFVFRL